MKYLALWLIPTALFCAQARYARLGDFEGSVEVQLHPADSWRPALRNLPLPESTWLRTGPQSRLEIEFDEGTAVRFGGDSLGELSDYSRLSTGQRITIISLDRGVAYLTGRAESRDALLFAVPGAQITIYRETRVRLEARDEWSQIAVLEGTVRFSSPAAELDLKEGRTIRVRPQAASRFYLYDEIAPLDTDRWNEERDKYLATVAPAPQFAATHYGLADLGTAGSWVETPEYGTVWRPKVTEGWVPFRNGKWAWYDGLGYTWVSADSWGWLPYHYGRWMQNNTLGWFWVPGRNATFHPGDVYWMQGAGLVGWGPLAPDETWQPPAVPRLYLHTHTTFAAFTQETRQIDPVVAQAQVKEPLVTAHFAAVLPSPSLPAARLDAVRPVLRAGSTRVVPVLEGVTFPDSRDPLPPPSSVPASSPSPPPPPRHPTPVYTTQQMPPQPPMVIVTEPAPSPPAPEPPADSLYLAPVYTGIVVVDPPLHHHDRDRDRGRERDHRGNSPPAQVTAQPSSSSAEPPGDSVRKSALDTAAGRQSDDRSRPRQ